MSNGCDLSSFTGARYAANPNSTTATHRTAQCASQAPTLGDPLNGSYQRADPNAVLGSGAERCADAALARELSALTSAANRANATIYTIDPRGVVGGADTGEDVDPGE